LQKKKKKKKIENEIGKISGLHNEVTGNTLMQKGDAIIVVNNKNL
jgi:hypothetical protein